MLDKNVANAAVTVIGILQIVRDAIEGKLCTHWPSRFFRKRIDRGIPRGYNGRINNDSAPGEPARAKIYWQFSWVRP